MRPVGQAMAGISDKQHQEWKCGSSEESCDFSSKKGKGYVEGMGEIPIPHQEDLILCITTPSPIPKFLEIVRGLPEILTNCSRLRGEIFQSIMSNASLRSTSLLLTS